MQADKPAHIGAKAVGGEAIRVGRVRVPVRVASLAVSAALHILLALVAFLLVFQRPVAGRAGSEGFELAVITDIELQELQAEFNEQRTLELSTPAPDDAAMTADVPDPESLSLSVDDAPSALGGAGAAASGGGEGLDLGALGSGGASFFGVEAVGSRFAYIVDISGSMTGERLSAMKRQLIGSINGLLDHASFCVILYSSGSIPIGGVIDWTAATEENKRDVAMEIRAIDASGGTNPLPAFENVFDLQPRPDAIYFMTDGEFQEENVVIGRVSIMNGMGRRRVPIHCIAFVSRVSESVLQRIARQSGGTYAYVAGPTP